MSIYETQEDFFVLWSSTSLRGESGPVPLAFALVPWSLRGPALWRVGWLRGGMHHLSLEWTR